LKKNAAPMGLVAQICNFFYQIVSPLGFRKEKPHRGDNMVEEEYLTEFKKPCKGDILVVVVE
jgi:hypothetical protein